MKKTLLMLVLGTLMLTGCSTDADIASHNISKDAEQFLIVRRIVFYNGITDNYILSIEGRCSLEDTGPKLMVTCKEGPDKFKKHYLGRSDNVTYFAEQLETADVSTYRYKVIFKPTAIIPNVDVPRGESG